MPVIVAVLERSDTQELLVLSDWGFVGKASESSLDLVIGRGSDQGKVKSLAMWGWLR